MEGIEEGTALGILAAIGTDRRRWPSGKHVWSWLGRCPQHQISGGKVLSRRGRPRPPRGPAPPPPSGPPLPPPPRAARGLFRGAAGRPRTPPAPPPPAPQTGPL